MSGRRAAVLGSPIEHSLSPVLHRAAYAALGLDWSYEAIEVTEPELAGFLDGLDGSWVGLSLTMPLKRAVIPLLDDVEEIAATVEAVNTVLLTRERRVGHNTDVGGMVNALRTADPAARWTRAAVLGGGATAASALAALHLLGTSSIEMCVRAPARAAKAREIAARLGRDVAIRPWEAAGSALDADLVISTTPAGATDSLAELVPAAPRTLFDVVYDPWPTRFAAAWGSRGGTVISGLELLIEQAALQVRLMTPCEKAPTAAMREAALAGLAART